MLRSETLFGKRETTTPNSTTSTLNNNMMPTGGGISNGTSNIVKTTNSLGSNNSESGPNLTPVSVGNEGGSKLIVGPNIKLKGVEITDCDTLVVEGRVEATINSRVIQISESGAFKGSAEVDIAEIRGEYDGELTVRQKLIIYATGKVTGTVRYGKVVIEEGGQLSGDIQVGTAAVATKGLSVAKLG